MAIARSKAWGDELSTSSDIREALRSLPRLAAVSSGNRPTMDEIVFPDSHADILDPDVSLVIGNRGMGKTFWSLALADDALRPVIAKRYLASRSMRLEDYDVSLGFADEEGRLGIISRPDLESISERIPTDTVWRAVLIRQLASIARQSVPSKGHLE